MINEIWDGLRLLPFFSSPKRGFYDGKRGLRILATRRPTPGHTMAPASAVSPRRPCRQAGPHGPPRRPGPGLSPLGVSLAAALWPSSGPKGMRRHENCPACPGRPPPGSGPRGWWLSGPGGVGPGPPWAVAGLPRSVFAAARSAGGAAPPARLKAVLGAGPGSTAGRPPCGLAVPPVAAVWSLGAFLPPRVGRAALGLPWPVPAWGAVIGWPGAPSAPAAGMGAAPFPGPALWFSLAWSRAAAVPARASPVAPGNGDKAVRCPARGGSAACGRRGTARGQSPRGKNAVIANERHP